MNYEVVTLPEKLVVGVKARTKNTDPNMPIVIGGLWNHFYQDGIYQQIPNKVNEKALGIYSNYESDCMGEYDIFVGCEVDKIETMFADTVHITIPKQKYAKFIVRGHMQKAVAQFWEKLWEMNLERNYVCDFEEYQDGNVEDTEVHIYISLKE